MSLLSDMLRYGLPTVGAAMGGVIAQNRGKRSIAWIGGAALAGWGAGWVTQWAINAVLEPSPEQLPMASVGEVPIGQVDVPTVDDVISHVGEPPSQKDEPEKVSGVTEYEPKKRGKDGQPPQQPNSGPVVQPQSAPKPRNTSDSGFGEGNSLGGQGSV